MKQPESVETIRLNKAIASRSKYSRREADRLILEGRVNLGRQKIIDPATTVAPDADLFIDGKRLAQKAENYTVIVYHKPRGELVTKRDPEGRKTIYQGLSSRFAHFVPVGRLDYASEGLLLLTDAPDVADKLMNSEEERVYNIKIDGPVTGEMEAAMGEGLTLDDARAGGHEKSDIRAMSFAPFIAWRIEKNHPRYSRLKLALTEGKNREIRRFFAHFGRQVLDLKRVSFGKISLNALPVGKTRFLDKKEYDWLHDFLKHTQRSSRDKADAQKPLQDRTHRHHRAD